MTECILQGSVLIYVDRPTMVCKATSAVVDRLHYMIALLLSVVLFCNNIKLMA